MELNPATALAWRTWRRSQIRGEAWLALQNAYSERGFPLHECCPMHAKNGGLTEQKDSEMMQRTGLEEKKENWYEDRKASVRRLPASGLGYFTRGADGCMRPEPTYTTIRPILRGEARSAPPGVEQGDDPA